MNRSIRSTLALLAAAALSFTAPQSAWADSNKQPTITAVRADPALVSLEIVGENLGTKPPRVTLGNRTKALTVTSVTPTLVTALLPPGMAPGGYLLTFSAANGKSGRDDDEGANYDEFWVTLGAIGATGKDGAAGPAGPAGPMGATGLTGPVGPAGATGQQGPAGPAGATGQQGPAGPAGATGQQGPAGPAGATGQQGPAGSPGKEGPAGPAGVQGPAGKDGATGPVGPQGPAGIQGPAGPAGSGSSLPALESLVGLPCNVGTACQGVTASVFDEATFGVTLRCMPSTPRVLTVALAAGLAYKPGFVITTAPLTVINSTIGTNPSAAHSTAGTFCNGAVVQLTLTSGGTLPGMSIPVTGDCAGNFTGNSPTVLCTITMNADKSVLIGP